MIKSTSSIATIAFTSILLNFSSPSQATAQESVLIDDFSSGFFTSTLRGPAPRTRTTTSEGDSILGGTRITEQHLLESSRDSHFLVTFVDGALSINNSSGANSFVELRYPHLQHLLEREGELIIDIDFFDAPESSPIRFEAQIGDDIVRAGTVFRDQVIIPIEGFQSSSGELTLGITGPTGFDLELSRITYDPTFIPIPEPSYLLGSTLLGMGMLFGRYATRSSI